MGIAAAARVVQRARECAGGVLSQAGAKADKWLARDLDGVASKQAVVTE